MPLLLLDHTSIAEREFFLKRSLVFGVLICFKVSSVFIEPLQGFSLGFYTTEALKSIEHSNDGR